MLHLATGLMLATCAWAQDPLSVRDSLYELAPNATVDEPVDMTELIVNPNYDGDNRAGWEGTPATAVTWGTWEHWNHPFDNYQTIGTDLPNGVYELNASGLHRVGNYWDSWYASGMLRQDELRTAVLYGKSGNIDLSAPLMDLFSCATYEPASEYGTAEVGGQYIPDNPESFFYYTQGGYYGDNQTYIAVTDGTLTIGWRDLNYISGQWSITDNWQLRYLGTTEDAYMLIKEQQMNLVQDLSKLKAMEQLLTGYADAVTAFENATTAADIISTYQTMSSLRDALKANAEAYEAYQAEYNRIDGLMKNNEIYGEYRDILETYLMDYEEPGETYPNGTYPYIIDNMALTTEQLKAETEFLTKLYQTAVEKGIGNGTNITYMIKNADFSKSNFEGWETSRTNSGNFYSRTGGNGDGWQTYSNIWLGEAWNCSFDFHQTLENTIPDGLYELDLYALYRAGKNKYFPSELLPVEIYLNEFTTPVQNIICDGVTPDKAVNHENCWIDNVGSWPYDDRSDEYGYMPNSSHGASIAFNGGRYRQKAYAVVKGGKLTLGMHHTRMPYQDDDWCVWADWQLIFRAHDAEAVDAALANMQARAELLGNLTEAHLYKGHLTALNDALAKASASADNEERYAMLSDINDLINKAYSGIQVYDSLATAVNYILETAFTGNPSISPDRLDELDVLYNEYWDGINEGKYSDEQAREIIRSIYALEEFDVIYCYGDMIDGDWDQPCLLYPLKKQSNGHYTGEIAIQDRSEGWGGRASFFFVYQGKRLGRETGSLDRFFTPAHNSKKMGLLVNKDDDCFNTTGGNFTVDIDLENMTIEMHPVGEYPWPSNVYLAGTLPTGHWQRNDSWPLEHKGNGVYTGTVTLEHFQDGMAGVTLFACRDPYDWNHARYGNVGYTNDVTPGVVYKDLNRYRGDTKWLVPVGEYGIAFDMDNEIIVFCDPSEDPADGISTIDGRISLNGEVQVYNLTGQLLFQGNGKDFRLSSGTYIVRSAKGSMKIRK